MSRKKLYLIAGALFLALTTIIVAQSSTIVSRLKLDWPDLGFPGGAALHSKMTTLITRIGDNIDSRYEEFSSVGNATVVTHEHNFNVPFDDLLVILYSGVGSAKTRIDDPAAAGWTIAANGTNPKTQVDITTPATGGPHDFTVVVVDGRGDMAIQNKDAVDIRGGKITGTDIDGGTASNTSRLTVPKDTKTNLDALTRKEATLVYATDRGKLFVDNGTQLSEIGGAGGGSGFNLLALEGKNHNLEGGNPPTDWTASGGAFVAETGAPGFGVQSGSWDSDAINQTLKSANVTIPSGLGLKSCLARVYYKYTGTAGDYVLRVEDSTNAALTDDLSLNDTSGNWSVADIAFSCPSTGQIHVAFESKVADGAVLLFDEVHLGNDFRIGPNNENAELYLYAEISGSCNWTKSGASFGPFTVASGTCTPSAIIDPHNRLSSVNNNKPLFTINDLPAGRYFISMALPQYRNSVTSLSEDVFIGISDDGCTTINNANNPAGFSHWRAENLTGSFEYQTKGTRTFELCAKVDTGTVTMLNSSLVESSLKINIMRFPLQTPEDTVTLENQGWYIDAVISGANPNLGGVDVLTTPLEITDAGLQLTANTGSKPVEIACASGNASEGSTCSSSNESVGIAFEIPRAGSYLVCSSFNHQINVSSNGYVDASFSLYETQNNSDTTIVQGSDVAKSSFRTETGALQSFSMKNIKLCSVFNWTDVGKKTIRVKYGQDVGGGTIDTNSLALDGSTSNGNSGRKNLWTVYPITQTFPQAVALTGTVDKQSDGSLLIHNDTQDKDINVQVNNGGTPTTAMTVKSNGEVNLPNNFNYLSAFLGANFSFGTTGTSGDFLAINNVDVGNYLTMFSTRYCITSNVTSGRIFVEVFVNGASTPLSYAVDTFDSSAMTTGCAHMSFSDVLNITSPNSTVSTRISISADGAITLIAASRTTGIKLIKLKE